MTQTRPRKEDAIRNLLESMKQPEDLCRQRNQDLPPLDLGTPVPGEKPTLEIKGDNKTIVDWMNGHAKMKTLAGRNTSRQQTGCV